MSDRDRAAGQVGGERDANWGAQALSAQSRVSNVLAIGFMTVLGLGSLTWYYANTLLRQGQAKENAQAAAAKRAQADVPLPSLGRIDWPSASGVFAPAPAASSLPLAEIPLEPTRPSVSAPGPVAKRPEQLALERELSGGVFAAQGAAAPAGTGSAVLPADSGAAAREGGELPALLHASVTPAVRAQFLPAQRLLLPKGAFIDCTLETAIDSTLPGMTTCVMANDVFGVSGEVVLLERGTKLIGETRGQVQQGAARVFVLWSEARTPSGVIVPLDSPGADVLGRSGLPGEVNRHFWQRFGAAMLVSVIDGAVQGALQSARGGGGTIIVSPTTSQDVLTDVLKSTINIPPTVVKHNGDRIQVLVARDLDFRAVYELRSVAPVR